MSPGSNALTRIRSRYFLISCALGAASGGVASWYGKSMGLVPGILAGLALVVVAGQAGGFAGGVLRLILPRRVKGGSGADVSTDAVLLLSTFGAFFGFVAAVVPGAFGLAMWMAAGGAFIFGAAAGAAGDLAAVVLRMSVLEEQSDKERDSAARRDLDREDRMLDRLLGDGPEGSGRKKTDRDESGTDPVQSSRRSGKDS